MREEGRRDANDDDEDGCVVVSEVDADVFRLEALFK